MDATNDLKRKQDLCRLLNELAVPEESLSDLSSELPPASDFEPHSFNHPHFSQEGQVPEHFIGNSINSTIAQTSPLGALKGLNFEESQQGSEPSRHSHSFTPQQVSEMMN